MDRTSSKLVEFSACRCTLDADLDFRHAHWLRGAIGRMMDRPEFHHHVKNGFIYQHPLIRYFTCSKQAMIMGLANGAFLLRGFPTLETLSLGPCSYRVLGQSREDDRVQLGPCDTPVIYQFKTPYLALNQENHAVWDRSGPFARRQLLQRVVVGNLLSLAKAVNLDVRVRLHAEVDLVPDGWYELKPGLSLLGFRGFVQVNFLMPHLWGIGKSSARGFGTLTCEEAKHE